MARRSSPISRLGDSFSSVLRRLASEDELRVYQVWDFWDEIVGEAISRRAQPYRFRNGVLIVRVESHSWLQELQFLAADLRERLNARLGAPLVRELQLSPGTLQRLPIQASERRTPRRLEEPAPNNPLPTIADAGLAAAFARIAAARTRRLNDPQWKPDGRKNRRSGLRTVRR